MRLLSIAVCFACFVGCSSGNEIKDLPDDTISKKPAMWSDPGATPDQPLDSGAGSGMDAGQESGVPPNDAAVDDAALGDAGVGDAG